MRIAMLSSQMAYYGGEVHLRDLARGLSERRHAVTTLVRPGSGLEQRLHADGLPVHTLPLVDWYEPAGMLHLSRLLRRLRPDILHSHNPRDYYIAAVATLGTGIRNVGTRHQLRPITWPRLKHPFLRRFSAMIAVSEAVRDGLLASGLPARRLVTVPNGIVEPVADGSPAVLRRELGLAAETGPVVGFVGRLCPSKGPDMLLWAASLLRGRWPGLQVVLVGGDAGSGAFTRRLRDQARDLRLSVHFCGYRDGAARLLRAFDLLAVPSRAEPFGLVTAEALARGVPVVATRSGGSRELVRHEQDGLLVAPGDPEALAGAIHRLLADRDLHARCRDAGPRRVASSYTLERQVAATEKVYALVEDGAPLPAEIPTGGLIPTGGES
jgi:glycosyltransferase involved in cell wall biosynthesis